MNCIRCNKELVGRWQRKFCSQTCTKLYKKREHAPNWRGGIQIDNPSYYSDYDKIYGKQYRVKNKERLLVLGSIWRDKNRELSNSYAREWGKKNKEKRKAIVKACKLRRRAIGYISYKTIQQIYEENIKHYGTLTCYLCSKSIVFGDDTLDHIFPIARGGTNDKSNLAVAHRSCNSRKNTKTLEEYRKREGDKICH